MQSTFWHFTYFLHLTEFWDHHGSTRHALDNSSQALTNRSFCTCWRRWKKYTFHSQCVSMVIAAPSLIQCLIYFLLHFFWKRLLQFRSFWSNSSNAGYKMLRGTNTHKYLELIRGCCSRQSKTCQSVLKIPRYKTWRITIYALLAVSSSTFHCTTGSEIVIVLPELRNVFDTYIVRNLLGLK